MLIVEVMHMAQLKQNMYQHLRSAKEWLTKAEKAFEQQHDVRAELDLMLAQAELQHVKEANRSRQWRYKYLAFRHGLALTLAMFMAVAAGGVYWWTTKPEPVIPVPLAGQASLPVSVAVKEHNLAPVQPVQPIATQLVAPLPNKAEPLQQSEQSRHVEQSRQAEQPAPLSADEMQKLVRAAGKSLRGQ
jgi:ABC-type ATPase with predicted acetyltransferase domain